MSLNLQKKRLGRHLLVGGAFCLVTCGFFSSCTDGYDLDRKENPNLGSSVYGYLEDKGNFTNYLKLIDDLGEKEMLSHTGSKTVFAANDEAFANFFQSNKWGVKSYSELSTAQKKLLLYTSMIDNPLQLQSLASIVGPIEGEAMRRPTSSTIYDSVQVVSTKADEIPNTVYWTSVKNAWDKIVLFKDGSSASPMIFFVQKFLDQNLFTNEDVDFLYNNESGTHQRGDAYVNDAHIIAGNQSCKNGFVHQVDKVLVPLDNMAEIIRTNSQTKIFSKLLERFAVPYYDRTMTENYNYQYGTDLDSTYQKRYFSKERRNGGRSINTDNSGNVAKALLSYDPGWNAYYPDIYSEAERNMMMEDMGVMLVPTDDAMNEWWYNGSGQVIKDYYGDDFDNVPDNVAAKLINNVMLSSLVGSVPSKFSDVVNDVALPMGLTTDDVKEVIMGCNGAIYITKKVFPSGEYSSVLFPALINETMSIYYTAAMDETNKFYAFLNSMDAHYSLFLPTNDGLLFYVDPVSLGQTVTHIWKFRYDPTVKEVCRIYAEVYDYVMNSDGTWSIREDGNPTVIRTSNSASSMDSRLLNRLADIINNSMVIGDVEDGGEYYQTKGNSFVKVGGNVGVEGQMTVEGGYQIEQDHPINITTIYDMSAKKDGDLGNGKTYIIEDQPVMTATMSVADILKDKPEFSDFYRLLNDAGALSTTVSTKYVSGGWSSVSKNGNLIYVPDDSKSSSTTKESVNYLLNNYHYTIYCPTNDAMKEAFEAGLPDTTDIKNAEASGDVDSLYHVQQVLLNFIKYHIHDRSVFIDKNAVGGQFETDKSDPSSGRFYKVSVSVDGNSLTITDKMGTSQNVNKSIMSNVMAREYWLNSPTVSNATLIDNSSYVVLHAIDHPLRYSSNQFVYQKVETAEEEDAESKLRVFRR